MQLSIVSFIPNMIFVVRFALILFRWLIRGGLHVIHWFISSILYTTEIDHKKAYVYMSNLISYKFIEHSNPSKCIHITHNISLYFCLSFSRSSTNNAHIHYRRSASKVKNYYDHHGKRRAKFHAFPSKCWTRPNCRTISIWIWSIGQRKMYWPLDWAAAFICGVHALVK